MNARGCSQTANASYRTRDLYEAAFLYATRQKLLGLEDDSVQGRTFWFVFADGPTCEQLISDYWRREATVIAKDMADAVRSLKERIFNR